MRYVVIPYLPPIIHYTTSPLAVSGIGSALDGALNDMLFKGPRECVSRTIQDIPQTRPYYPF